MRRVVVIGAGAAGMMAAIFAASRGAEVLLLERTSDGGRKIALSGGGRCNLLPARLDERRYVTDSSPNALRKIVRSWPHREQVAFFECDLGIRLVEEDGDKLFPAGGRARDVRDGLLAFAADRGVSVRMGAVVTGLSPSGGGWSVELGGQGSVSAHAVVVATGGLSFPETGSDGLGLGLLKGLGHDIVQTYPALTPVTARPAPFGELAGISLSATVTARSKARNAEAHGGFLFTHRGYSGPAVLDVSHVVSRSMAERRDRAVLLVRWKGLSDADWDELLRPRGTRTVAAAVRAELPERLAMALLERARVEPTRALSHMPRDERLRLLTALTCFELPWTGDGGYAAAEVTGGGVSLSDVSPATLESRKRPGLFICGEVLDAFGPIGGYNFLWAWVTGRAAGLGAAAGPPLDGTRAPGGHRDA